MKRFKVLEREFKITNVNELSKGHRVSKIMKCVVEDLDTGELLKIKPNTSSDLEKKIINKIDDFDCECGDVIIIR